MFILLLMFFATTKFAWISEPIQEEPREDEEDLAPSLDDWLKENLNKKERMCAGISKSMEEDMEAKPLEHVEVVPVEEEEDMAPSLDDWLKKNLEKKESVPE